MAEQKTLAPGQRAYEARRAEKAGMTLEQWLRSKQRQQALAAEVSKPPPPPRKKGLITRLIDRAHQPLKPASK
jgi:hypothetical protein